MCIYICMFVCIRRMHMPNEPDEVRLIAPSLSALCVCTYVDVSAALERTGFFLFYGLGTLGMGVLRMMETTVRGWRLVSRMREGR